MYNIICMSSFTLNKESVVIWLFQRKNCSKQPIYLYLYGEPLDSVDRFKYLLRSALIKWLIMEWTCKASAFKRKKKLVGMLYTKCYPNTALQDKWICICGLVTISLSLFISDTFFSHTSSYFHSFVPYTTYLWNMLDGL